MYKAGINNWSHFLFMGCDSQKPDKYERSDSIIVASINRKHNRIMLTSILRDMWVELPGHGMGKVNAAVWYGGGEMAMEVISGCLGIEIKKYAMVNLSGMVDIIDLVGGVDTEITESERKFINHFAVDTALILNRDFKIPSIRHPGMVHLNGLQTVSYMRERNDGGDYERTVRQRKVLRSMAKKVLANKSPLKIIGLVKGVKGNLLTNIGPVEIITLAPFLLRMKGAEIKSLRIPAEGTYEIINDGIWRIEPDYDKNRKIFRQCLFF